MIVIRKAKQSDFNELLKLYKKLRLLGIIQDVGILKKIFKTNKDELFEIFLKIKEKEKLEVFDAHIHPIDILGLATQDKSENSNKTRILKPSLIENLEYNMLATNILKCLFLLTPNIIRDSINNSFSNSLILLFISS